MSRSCIIHSSFSIFYSIDCAIIQDLLMTRSTHVRDLKFDDCAYIQGLYVYQAFKDKIVACSTYILADLEICHVCIVCAYTAPIPPCRVPRLHGLCIRGMDFNFHVPRMSRSCIIHGSCSIFYSIDCAIIQDLLMCRTWNLMTARIYRVCMYIRHLKIR